MSWEIVAAIVSLVLISLDSTDEFRLPLHPSEDDKDYRIVGGSDVSIREVPYQAALSIDSHYFCGGAVISRRYVITGAHCIIFFYRALGGYRGTDANFAIRLGSDFNDRGGVVFRPENVSCHPDFNFENYDYDVCLLRTSEPILFGKTVRPVKLADVEPEGGEMGLVAGWGSLWENGKVPERLQAVRVPLVNKTHCEDVYETINPITERMICAGEEGKDSCQGDSGGGLVAGDRLVGVISTGFGCGVKNYPGVYTSIAHPEIREFIRNVTGL